MSFLIFCAGFPNHKQKCRSLIHTWNNAVTPRDSAWTVLRLHLFCNKPVRAQQEVRSLSGNFCCYRRLSPDAVQCSEYALGHTFYHTANNIEPNNFTSRGYTKYEYINKYKCRIFRSFNYHMHNVTHIKCNVL